ncbi:MAG: helix-turn-helix domain-containing protein [Planctomycetota bacterium]
MTKPSPYARAVAQPRAEKTAQRLLEAAHELFAKGVLEEVSVAEIARRAGVSVGGFYGRFRSKADLSRAVAEAMAERLLAMVDAALEPEETAGLSAGAIIRRYAAALVAGFGGDDRDALRRVTLLARSDRDLPTSTAIRALNARVQERLADALLNSPDSIDHDDPRRAIAFADLALSAAAREALLHGGTGLRFDRRALVDELTALGCGYLRISPPED